MLRDAPNSGGELNIETVLAAFQKKPHIWDVNSWPGRCYAIATSILDEGLIDGRAEYGIWHGPVAPGSPFDGRPVPRHGWIRLPDGRVCDPTRWVFEGVDPYIYIGSADHYDMGAAKLREEVLGYQRADENLVLDFLDDPNSFEDDLKTLHLLANTPPDTYPYLMAEVYETIDRLGRAALIPIDYQDWAGMR